MRRRARACIVAFAFLVLSQRGLGSSHAARHAALQDDADEAGPKPQKPLSPAEKKFIMGRLRSRKEAIKRLALEDALGEETREQARAEAGVLTTMGSGAFIGADEQKAKLTAYAADAADALERARRMKEAAEEATSEAASVAVLSVARAPNPDPMQEERAKRAAVLAAARPEDRSTVSSLLEAVDKGEQATLRREEAGKAAAEGEARRRLSEAAQREAEEAARKGPQALQLLAMRQMADDLRRVRRLGGQADGDEDGGGGDAAAAGQDQVAGPIQGSLADSMGWSAPLQG